MKIGELDRILSAAVVRHVGPGGPFGEPVDLDDPATRWDLREEIADEVLHRGATGGEVEVGGQRYRWRRGTPRRGSHPGPVRGEAS